MLVDAFSHLSSNKHFVDAFSYLLCIVAKIKKVSLQFAAEGHTWAGLPQPSLQSVTMVRFSYWKGSCGKCEIGAMNYEVALCSWP